MRFSSSWKKRRCELAAVIFFLAAGAAYVKPEHWSPFAPFGWPGIMAAAAVVFFAYIGFDAISTTAEEAKHPQRDLPIGEWSHRSTRQHDDAHRHPLAQERHAKHGPGNSTGLGQ